MKRDMCRGSKISTCTTCQSSRICPQATTAANSMLLNWQAWSTDRHCRKIWASAVAPHILILTSKLKLTIVKKCWTLRKFKMSNSSRTVHISSGNCPSSSRTPNNLCYMSSLRLKASLAKATWSTSTMINSNRRRYLQIAKGCMMKISKSNNKTLNDSSQRPHSHCPSSAASKSLLPQSYLLNLSARPTISSN